MDRGPRNAHAMEETDDVKRMLADLGFDRRERIVNSDADPPREVDHRALEQRRREVQSSRLDYNIEGESVRLRTWNTAYTELQHDGAAGEADFNAGQTHRANLAARVEQTGTYEPGRTRGQATRGGRAGRGGRGGGNIGRNSPRVTRDLPRPKITGPRPTTAVPVSNDARNFGTQDGPRRAPARKEAFTTVTLGGTRREVAPRQPHSGASDREGGRRPASETREAQLPRHPDTPYEGQLASPNDFMARRTQIFGGHQRQRADASSSRDEVRVSIPESAYNNLVSAQPGSTIRLDQQQTRSGSGLTGRPNGEANDNVVLPGSGQRTASIRTSTNEDEVSRRGPATSRTRVVPTGDLLDLGGEETNDSYASDLAGLEYSAESDAESEDDEPPAANGNSGYAEDGEPQRTPQPEPLTRAQIEQQITSLTEAINGLHSFQLVRIDPTISTAILGIEQQRRHFQHMLETGSGIQPDTRESPAARTPERLEANERRAESPSTPRPRPVVRLPASPSTRDGSPTPTRPRRQEASPQTRQPREGVPEIPTLRVTKPSAGPKSISQRLDQIREDWVLQHCKVGLEHSLYYEEELHPRIPRRATSNTGIGSHNLPGYEQLSQATRDPSASTIWPDVSLTRSNSEARSIIQAEARAAPGPSTAVTSTTASEEDLAARMRSISLHEDTQAPRSSLQPGASEVRRQNTINYSPQQMLELRVATKKSQEGAKKERLHARDESAKSLKEDSGEPQAKTPKNSQYNVATSPLADTVTSVGGGQQREQNAGYQPPPQTSNVSSTAGNRAGQGADIRPSNSRAAPRINQRYVDNINRQLQAADPSLGNNRNASLRGDMQRRQLRSNVPDSAATRQYAGLAPRPEPIAVAPTLQPSASLPERPPARVANTRPPVDLPNRPDFSVHQARSSQIGPAQDGERLTPAVSSRSVVGSQGQANRGSSERQNGSIHETLAQHPSVGGRSRWDTPDSQQQSSSTAGISEPRISVNSVSERNLRTDILSGGSRWASAPAFQPASNLNDAGSSTHGGTTSLSQPLAISTREEQIQGAGVQGHRALGGASRWADPVPSTTARPPTGSRASSTSAGSATTHRRRQSAQEDPVWNRLYNRYEERQHQYLDHLLPEWMADDIPELGVQARNNSSENVHPSRNGSNDAEPAFSQTFAAPSRSGIKDRWPLGRCDRE